MLRVSRLPVVPLFGFLALSLACSQLAAHDRILTEFRRIALSEEFVSEGASFADLDGDGHHDVISGPYWYAGPEFRERRAYTSPRAVPIKQYSDFFFSFTHDFNGDGRIDILSIPMPGAAGHWFENPGRTGVHWRKHLALDEVSNESPTLVDITGDGRPELVCIRGGAYGYAEPDWDAPTRPWAFTPITPNRGYGRFTHGLGVGDVNGDGRPDLLETNGWWEQSRTRGELFRFHPVRFAESGAAQIFAYDFDGDGDRDVVATQNAHAYGLAWFEQTAPGEFTRHPILTRSPSENPYGLAISQMHAVALADVDGDGVQDIITGKRYFAHGGGDPGAHELAVLYWLKTHRDETGTWFEPWLVDARSGVGTQLVAGDVTGDGRTDILVGNKLGTYVMVNRGRSVSRAEYEAARPKRRSSAVHVAGTSVFSQHVRTTPPLTAVEAARGFVVPPGFEVQLVASEPDIAKPLNLAFDARGRLWVTSSEEYPYAAPPDRKPKDTIKILVDEDGDGRADSVTTFADGLNIPIGLYPHADGVIVFSIPNIWFLRDTDGDDRADVREKLYGPVGWERDTHGLCNAFTRGLDGWLYACHGFNNETRLAGRDGHEIHMRSGNIWRMKVDGSRVEQFTYGQVNPFGLAFDRYGDLYSADCHTKPVTLLIEGGRYDHFGAPGDGLGFVPNVMEHLHGSTAIAGIAVGESTNFPSAYQRSTFDGNVMTSRINRNSLERDGASVRAREESDFLVSNDPWFRPVDLQVGPDGALYVADFYNRIIGHYEVPLDHPGRDRHRGRIWRVVYRDQAARRDAGSERARARVDRTPDLTRWSLEEAVAALDTNLETRAQLLVERILGELDEKALELVVESFRRGAPLARARASWILHRSGHLTDERFSAAGADRSPLVRVHAMRIAALRDDALSLGVLRAGLRDAAPLVRRAAATAAATRPARDFIDPLLHTLVEIGERDPHLRYSLRLALRSHLQNENWFAEIAAGDLPANARAELADLCLALKTAAAGEFLAAHLLRAPIEDRGRLTRYLRFAVRHVSPDSIRALVELVRDRFEGAHALQLELLDAVRAGLESRGLERPAVVVDWARALSTWYLGVGGEAQPKWSFARSNDGAPNPFAPEQRTSSDGDRASWFVGSLAAGEKLTGSVVSREFTLPQTLSFFLAGHSGPPPRPARVENHVALVLSGSGEVLRRELPPRNDIAQRVEWDLTEHAGAKARLKIVDGISADGFAWISAGRFSVTGVNPTGEDAIEKAAATTPLSWSFLPHPDTPERQTCWVVSTRRQSSDGRRSTRLWSSFPRGEQRTGIFRSQSFSLPEAFRFFLAGHDGAPPGAPSGRNAVHVRDAGTHRVLKRFPPPRNDVAQRVTWQTGDLAGRRVYCELVDGDSRGAFAWLAAGRFSVDGLNPSEIPERVQTGARLASEFRLESLRGELATLLRRHAGDRDTSSALADSLAGIDAGSISSALADVARVRGADLALRRASFEALIAGDANAATASLATAMKAATAAEQLRLADRLASDPNGASLLVSFFAAGTASTRLLAQVSFRAKLSRALVAADRERVEGWVRDLPDESTEVAAELASRRKRYLERGGEPGRGREIFKKQCAVCHRVGDEGAPFAPNLDGIGNRGLDRLLEDIVAPNRNVDVAFRQTTIVTVEGDVLSGLLRPSDDALLTIIDREGKELRLAKDQAAEVTETSASPMPGNVGEILSDDEFSDLLGYLLSLR